MTLQELIELAILDAMGLLDEEERLAFELAFRAAAPAVQAQVRREQTRLSRIEAILPDVTAPAGLRAAVIEAVRREIATAETAGTNPALMIASSMVKPTGVSRMWRTASLGLAAAALLLSVFTFMLKNTYEDLQGRLRNDALLEAMNKTMGYSFTHDLLFAKDTHRVVLTPTSAAGHAVASVFVNGDSKDALFFCQSLKSPPNRTFKIAIVDDNNNVVRELATFESTGELLPVKLRGLNSADTGRLAVGTFNESGQLDSIVAEAKLSEKSL